jgi:rRNA maturation endonuclease Nob1
MKVVLDTSAIISGLHASEDENEYYITAEVLKEIKDENARLKVELTIKEGKIMVEEPQKRFIEQIKKQAKILGEDESLSDADKAVLSLALGFKEIWEDVLIVSDDYGIQNVSSSLSINFASIGEKGIKRVLTWHYVCRGCGQNYEKNVNYCEICGSRVKRRVKRSH